MRPITYIPRYTIEDYRRWEGDWELIDGLPYAMSPSPIIRHQQLALKIAAQLDSSVNKNKDHCGNCIVTIDVDWVIDNSTVVRPDIAVICDKHEDFITSPPVLIIEILSPSTAFKDRNVKFDIYCEQGVKYYIMVDPDRKTYIAYRLINKQYKEENAITSFVLHENCEITVDIGKIISELVD